MIQGGMLGLSVIRTGRGRERSEVGECPARPHIEIRIELSCACCLKLQNRLSGTRTLVAVVCRPPITCSEQNSVLMLKEEAQEKTFVFHGVSSIKQRVPSHGESISVLPP